MVVLRRKIKWGGVRGAQGGVRGARGGVRGVWGQVRGARGGVRAAPGGVRGAIFGRTARGFSEKVTSDLRKDKGSEAALFFTAMGGNHLPCFTDEESESQRGKLIYLRK